MSNKASVYASCEYFNAIECYHIGMTRELALVNKKSDAHIGTIKWFGKWRQYCLFPEPDTHWSDACLSDVRDLLEKLKAERLQEFE